MELLDQFVIRADEIALFSFSECDVKAVIDGCVVLIGDFVRSRQKGNRPMQDGQCSQNVGKENYPVARTDPPLAFGNEKSVCHLRQKEVWGRPVAVLEA